MSSSPGDLFDRASGLTIGQAINRGIITWILAVVFSIAAGLQQIFEFLFLPFVLFIDVAEASIQSFFITPMRIVFPGFIETAARLGETFGILSLPGAAILALITIGIAIVFLSFGITSDFVPGVVVDNPIWDFFFTTPEEEAEGED